MEAGHHGTELRVVEYVDRDGGELITGTKEQLLELGIGVGCVFPGELGGPRSVLKTLDPRGFQALISKRDDDGRFYCSITFPNLPESPTPLSKWSPARLQPPGGVSQSVVRSSDMMLFAPPPAEAMARAAYNDHVMNSLRELVDLSQSSAY